MTRADGKAPGPKGLAWAIIWLLRQLAPRHAAAAERESREWFAVCRECGTARSYWELGAIRYKAASRGKRIRLTCPSCGVKRWHSVERRAPDPVE